MPSTPKGYPYPADTSTPDVPRDIEALAQACEDTVAVVHVAAGTTDGTGNLTVTFPPGKFTSAPTVIVCPRANAMGSALVSVAAGSVTTTSCLVTTRTQGSGDAAGGVARAAAFALLAVQL